MGVGGVLWLCPEGALGGYFDSTGNAIGSAKPDFWKEGVGGKWQKHSLQPASCAWDYLFYRFLSQSPDYLSYIHPTKYAQPLPVSHT